jgi:hypothetical protein
VLNLNRFTARLGGDTCSRLSLTLDWQLQQAELEWVFTPPPGSGLPARQERVSAPVSLLARVFYTVGLGIRDGRIAATLASPAVLAMPNPSGRYWTCLAALGDGAALTVFDSAYTVGAEGTILGRGKLTAGASELRTWSARRGTGLGVCLGEQRRLLLGTVTPGSEATWTELLTSAVGPGIGSGQGFLAYPVSFDVAPDGRIFVLDAGLRRVVVFGSNRKYLTSWGTEGAGDGEFSLGKGNARGEDGTLDLYGSLLVGSDGAVYVADPGNQRIQRFAP